MLATDDRLIGIVAEAGQLFTPPGPDRLLRGKHDTHGGLQAQRPELRQANRRAGPADPPHQAGKLALAEEEPLLFRRSAADLRFWNFHLRRSLSPAPRPCGATPVFAVSFLHGTFFYRECSRKGLPIQPLSNLKEFHDRNDSPRSQEEAPKPGASVARSGTRDWRGR